MTQPTKSPWRFCTALITVLALFSSALLMSPNSLSCCSTDPFFQSPTYLQPHEFKRMINFYYSEAKIPSSHEENITLETYTQKIEALFKEKKLPFTPEEIERPGNYYGALQTNHFANALEFLTQAARDSRVKKDWPRLVSLRQDLLTVFKKNSDSSLLLDKIRTLKNGDVGPYGAYLEGAYLFYAGSYQEAAQIFAHLKTPEAPTFFSRISDYFGKVSSSDWIEDTAQYMEARTYLIMAQDKIDGYESDAERAQKMNVASLGKAWELFQTYLKERPKGRYVHSTKNLERRIFSLSGMQNQLDNALKTYVKNLLSESPSPADVHEAFSEFSYYFKGNINPETDAPLVVAYGVQNEIFSKGTLPQVLKSLDTRAKEYTAYPGLVLFLKAVILSRLEQHEQLLQEIPFQKDFPKEDIVGLGTQVIRARSLRDLERAQEALSALKHFGPLHHDDHLDFEIYTTHLDLQSAPESVLMDLSSDTVIDVFLEKLTSTPTLEHLLKKGDKFSPDLVKKIKHALTRRYLLSGRLKEAVDLDALDEELRPVLVDFLKNPQDNAALLSLAKTLMDTTHPWNEDFDAYELEEICPSCKIVANDPVVPPLTYFMRVVENHKKRKQTSAIEAEALHHICSFCFKGSYYANSCLWQSWWRNPSLKTIHDTKLPVWFKRLHKIYKGTQWAKETPYWH